jgi:hypothetical protein
MRSIGRLFSNFWRRINLKWYEIITAVLGLLILIASILAWLVGTRNLESALKIAEPAFLAAGALSIVLLWAQLRSASNQERNENIWKRVVCLHENFRDVPRIELAEAVRNYFCELKIDSPPSAYIPVTERLSHEIMADSGNGSRAPAKVLIKHYLNDWEDFCGAISVGVIDEDYAREMEGSRLIDTFFGYREVINRLREARARDGQANAGTTGAPAFVNKLYYEMQVVAVRWHKRRTEEWAAQEARMNAANVAADQLKAAAEAHFGVPPKVKEREKGRFG